MKNIILCGLPMSGKTTIGKLLAKELEWNFIDTDSLIERAYAEEAGKHHSCRQICAEKGEKLFRELENQQIATLKDISNSIISVGGGSLCHRENLTMLRSIGDLVYLKASIDTLWRRIQCRGIPAYLDPVTPEKAFYEITKTRIPIYEETAHFVIDTCLLNEQDVVAAILTLKDR